MNRLVTLSCLCISLLSLTGCATQGPKFVEPVTTAKDTSAIYLMRQSKFVGAMVCRPVLLDEIAVGCLQNGGFLRLQLAPGEHTLTMPKVNSSDWFKPTSLKGNFEAGKTYYAEWRGDLTTFLPIPNGAFTSVIGSAGAALVEYKESAALPILQNLYDSQ